MANHLYGYASSKYGTSPEKSASAASLYAAASLSLTDTYLSRRYLSASDPLASSDLSKWNSSSSSSSSSSVYLNLSLRDSSSAAASHLSSWPPPPPPGVDVDSLIPGIKRSSDALYQTVLGSHNSIGLSESWYSTNSLAKRSRLEIASNLSLYPQRPGEKDCAHYMLTRTCKFGDSCKFDHPVWVPEGGIPDWKEEMNLDPIMEDAEYFGFFDLKLKFLQTCSFSGLVPVFSASEYLPDRPGEPDCPYFLKTQRCKYGFKCKFNHPKGTLGALENIDTSALPERPSETLCAFYMKTGKCKYGATCKFHHPKDILIQDSGNGEKSGSAVKSEGTMGNVNVVAPSDSLTPAPYYNSKGLPIRLGEVDCPFYLKTGSCKYGATCRYNHPDRNAINPPAAAMGHSILAPSATSLNIGVVNPAASIYQAIDPILAQPTLVVGTTLYPQRPGQTECDYYMKTGECKFGERCKFHHPIDRSASTTKPAPQETFKLTLAGLPRREGAVHCPYYMKTGTCRYGATCKFDHPPPAEVMAIAALQGTSTSAGVQDSGAG